MAEASCSDILLRAMLDRENVALLGGNRGEGAGNSRSVLTSAAVPEPALKNHSLFQIRFLNQLNGVLIMRREKKTLVVAVEIRNSSSISPWPMATWNFCGTSRSYLPWQICLATRVPHRYSCRGHIEMKRIVELEF